MRRALLVIIGIETLVWLYLVIGGLNDALFFAKGYGREAAQLANMVFMLLVLPAGILAKPPVADRRIARGRGRTGLCVRSLFAAHGADRGLTDAPICRFPTTRH